LEGLTVSFHNISPFDIIADQQSQFLGFGNLIPSTQERIESFDREANLALARIEEGFEVKFSKKDIAAKLEQIIIGMWDEGWNPEQNDVNLFVTDFGLLLTKAITKEYGGELTFRSDTDLNHLSIWWDDCGVEAFPFHKVYKRLMINEGESIKFFTDGLSRYLSKD